MTDATAMILGIAAALPTTIASVAALVQSIKTHAVVNSKMDLLLKTVRAEGVDEGEKKERLANATEKAAFNAGQAAQKESQAVKIV